jgi:RNA polymerase sigma factor (sigma-70 family)
VSRASWNDRSSGEILEENPEKSDKMAPLVTLQGNGGETANGVAGPTSGARRGDALRHLQTLFELGTTGELTDGQLLARFATRDGEAAEMAFSALVERHGPMVLRTCRSVLRDPHAAEDAFQATFLVLVEKARGLWVRDSLGPWLHQVACRVSSCARAEAARRRRIESQARPLEPRSAVEASPDDLGGVLHEELGRLPEKYRAAVVLCCLEGLTIEQAARRLGWPQGTIQSRLARGRQRLRDRLAGRGLAPSAGALGVALAAEQARAEVPVALAEATARAGMCVATGKAAAGMVPAAVMTLTEGVLRTMSLTRLKLTAIAVLIGFGVGSGVVVHRIASRASAQEAPRPAGTGQPPKSSDSPKAPDQIAYRQALALLEAMVREHPQDAEYRAALARSYLTMGIHLQKRGRTAEAEQLYRRALAILEALVREQPDVIAHRAVFARVLDRLGGLLGAAGRHQEAMETHRRAIAIQERLVSDHPSLPQARGDLARSYTNLGELHEAMGRLAEAERSTRQALAIQERLVESHPDRVEFRSDLADSYEGLSTILEATGRAEEAESLMRRTMAIREGLVAGRRASGK